MFKLGQMVWCKDKTNCDGSYTQTRYHVPCIVCDIREQKMVKLPLLLLKTMNILNIVTE